MRPALISWLAPATIALSLIGTLANGQVLQRRLPPPPVAPTEPQQTQEQTAAEQAAKDAATPPSPDPAGTPPSGPSPGDDTPAPPSAAPATALTTPEVRRSLVPATSGAGVAQLAIATMTGAWERLPDCAKRISIASATRIYVVGCGGAGDLLIHRWVQDHWESTGLAGVSVAAVEGLPSWAGGALPTSGFLPVTAADTARPDGFQEQATGGGWWWGIMSAAGQHSGGPVFRSNCRPSDAPGGCRPEGFGGTLMSRIAAGLTDGIAWVIGEDGRIYRQVDAGSGWLDRPGCATSIANAGGDRVWVVGCEEPDADGNRPIYHWNGSDWTRMPGAAKEIAVEPDDRAWVLTADGGIWRRR